MLKPVQVRWFCGFVLCSFAAATAVVALWQTDSAHTDPSAMAEWSWAHPAQADTEPNKRQQPNPDPQLFSVTLQAQKEMDNLEMDVSAMNPQRTADTEQARGALESCPQPHRNALHTAEPHKGKAEFWEVLSDLPIVGSTNNPLVVEPDAANQLFMAFQHP